MASVVAGQVAQQFLPQQQASGGSGTIILVIFVLLIIITLVILVIVYAGKANSGGGSEAPPPPATTDVKDAADLPGALPTEQGGYIPPPSQPVENAPNVPPATPNMPPPLEATWGSGESQLPPNTTTNGCRFNNNIPQFTLPNGADLKAFGLSSNGLNLTMKKGGSYDVAFSINVKKHQGGDQFGVAAHLVLNANKGGKDLVQARMPMYFQALGPPQYKNGNESLYELSANTSYKFAPGDTLTLVLTMIPDDGCASVHFQDGILTLTPR
jgi:hypothetical protein